MAEAAEKSKTQTPSRSATVRYFITIVFIVAILAGTGFGAYYYYTKYQAAQALLKDPTRATQQQIESIVAEVGALIELPQGETPTIATVSDPSKLKDQAFFAKAVVGDKVLIYPQAKKAVLYRPSTRKIIEVGPVSFPTVTPTPMKLEPTPTPEEEEIIPTPTRSINRVTPTTTEE